MIVSVFPLEFVNVKTDFRRYVPLASPLLVLENEIVLWVKVLDQYAPSTTFHIANQPLYFSKVCSTVMLTAFLPPTTLVQYAVLPLTLRLLVGFAPIS